MLANALRAGNSTRLQAQRFQACTDIGGNQVGAHRL
jgi:hypothetical protein